MPAFRNSLSTASYEQSTTRQIDRIDDPSQSIDRIWARLCVSSLFMTQKVTDVMAFDKHYVGYDFQHPTPHQIIDSIRFFLTKGRQWPRKW
jgi:hypothetical protein